MELAYEVHMKNGKTFKISRERYEIVRLILADKITLPASIELDKDTIIFTSNIAYIEKEDDGRFQ